MTAGTPRLKMPPAMYYSQFGEDRILFGLLGFKKDGWCVEVGANDGVHGSTTLYFEKLGWTCVLIEPNPDLAAKLRAERSAKVFEYAASSDAGEATLLVAEGAEFAHGVSTVCVGEEAVAKLNSYGFSARPVAVRSARLDAILDEAEARPPIDFMSIDVEGHELEVLKGFTVERWKPRIVIVEDNAQFADPAVRNHLARSGYRPFLRTGVNDWYARREDTLVTGRRRLRYGLAMLEGRGRALARRIPGVRSLYTMLRERLA